jgi:hypothetical protein
MKTEADAGGTRCDVAFANVRASVDPERRFPRNVFVENWSDFLFFDADWMTASDLVEHVQAFLAIDGARCACLWKLDGSEDAGDVRFCVNAHTTRDEYHALLGGTTPGYGWLDAMERLACASDVGEWCMYCEPNNEIAVVGLRGGDAARRYASATARVHAEPFDDAIRAPALSYGFSEHALSRAWSDVFAREYRRRPTITLRPAGRDVGLW